MTNREKRIIQESEARAYFFRSYYEWERATIESSNGYTIDDHLRVSMYDYSISERDYLTEWCAIYTLMQHLGIESDITLPDSKEAAQYQEKIIELFKRRDEK